MTENIVTESTAVNLTDLAAEIRLECAAANEAGRSHLEHVFAAGKRLIAARDLVAKQRIAGGFRAWLQEVGVNRTDAYDYIALAQNEERVRNSGHSSAVAALRMLRAKPWPGATGKSNKSAKPGSGSPLTKSAWTAATVEERRRFLDSVGADALCAAFSLALRAELRRRVAGQRAAQASALSDTIAAGLRQALSLQKTSKPKDAWRWASHPLSMRSTTSSPLPVSISTTSRRSF